jgi:hypothetical protein
MTEIRTMTGCATRLPKQIKKLNAMQGHAFTPTDFCSHKRGLLKKKEYITQISE